MRQRQLIAIADRLSAIGPLSGAAAVSRAAVALGISPYHPADFFGPRVTNEIMRAARMQEGLVRHIGLSNVTAAQVAREGWRCLVGELVVNRR